MVQSARKNAEAATVQIMNTNMFSIYDQISCCVGGTPRKDERTFCGLSCGTKDSQLESELKNDVSTTTADIAASTIPKLKVHVHAISTTSTVPFSFFIMNFQSKGVQRLQSVILPACLVPHLFTLKSRLIVRDFARFSVFKSRDSSCL